MVRDRHRLPAVIPLAGGEGGRARPSRTAVRRRFGRSEAAFCRDDQTGPFLLLPVCVCDVIMFLLAFAPPRPPPPLCMQHAGLN